MKTISLFAVLICSVAMSAQQIIPMVNIDNLVAPRTTTTKIVNRSVDSVLVATDTITSVSEETGHENDKIFIMGIGSTDALSFDKLSVAGTFTAAFRIHPRWYSQVTFNYGNTISETKSADSVLLSELYFPDLSNAACAYSTEIIGCAWGADPNAQHSLVVGFDATLQRKQIATDSLTYKLGIVNFTPGIKYRWMYRGREDVRSSLVIGAFWNYVAINEGSEDSFNTLYNDDNGPKISRQFNGFSLLISYQIQNSIFYARSFTDMNRSGDLGFSIGIKQAVTFKSF